MEEELTEKAKSELAEKLGLNREPFKSNLFQGDFGFSIDFSTLIPILVLAAFLFVHHRRKNRMKKK